MAARRGMLAFAARTAAVSRAMARLTGVLIIVIMLGVVVDAVFRGGFGVALWGIHEVGVLILLALIYFGLPATQAGRENFRVSILADRFPRALDLIVTWLLLAVQVAVIGILCWVTWRSAIFSFNRDEVSFGLVQIPLWPSRAMVASGLTLLLIQTLASALEYALAGKHPYKVDLATELKGEVGSLDPSMKTDLR
jgi:TRAP-type mannitol/chloroaromatic compound transport system permease small subunit